MSAARTASASRIRASAGSSSPALPRSPLVSRSTVTADPARERRLMVPPQLTVSSSGWANTSKTLLNRRISRRRTDLSVVKATPADQAPRMSAAATRTANVIAQESFQTVTARGRPISWCSSGLPSAAAPDLLPAREATSDERCDRSRHDDLERTDRPTCAAGNASSSRSVRNEKAHREQAGLG